MRTYKDAKAMAKALRGSLAAQSVVLSHSQCLEIVANQFGFADWNTLSAQVLQATSAPKACSFCGKSQYSARGLVEGSCSRARRVPAVRPSQENCVFICDECITWSAEVVADILGDSARTS